MTGNLAAMESSGSRPAVGGFRSHPRREGVCLATGLLAAMVGVAVLYGWVQDLAILKSIRPDWVSMKPNTALCFVLIGLALALTPFSPASPTAHRLSRLFALLVSVIGLLTLAEYLSGADLGFDQWLFTEPVGTAGASYPGRMAPDTALCFILLGLGLALLLSPGRWETAALFGAVTLALLVAIVAVLELFSRAIRPGESYGLWGFTIMAVHTASLFACLGAVLAWRAWPAGVTFWSMAGRAVTSMVVWTVLLGGSMSWSLQDEWNRVVDSAKDSARASIRKDISFRKWATSHGGVYVEPSALTPPNPYLNLPTRDVQTTTGKKLTLMNPAYMLREMQQNFSDDYGTRGHLTSLKPLNPKNGPDPWESQVLTAFERDGTREFSEVRQIDGQPYLRMMVPFIIETGCLKCHASQGYNLGDIRGGVSSAIPLTHLLAERYAASNRILATYGGIWLLGIAGMTFFYRREYRLTSENEQERAFSDAAINSLPGVFYAYESGVRLVRWNKNLEKVSGYSAEELLNKHPLDWFADKERKRVEAALTATDQMNLEAEVVFKDKIVPYYLTGSWLILGKKRYLIGFGIDLTERRELEEGLRQAQKLESLGTLAGGIAHDFNNILSAIIGYNDLAIGQAEENRPCLEELAEVRKAAARASKLVQQILTISRKQSTEKNPLQVSLVVKEALKLLRATIPTTIEIRQEINSNSRVVADPTQIHQVIMNLCTNAYQAMAEQGGVLSVALDDIVTSEKMMDGLTELPAGRYVLLSVSDTGPGMDREIMHKIFDPYFTTKGVGKGTGLGLAVVQGIVKGHQGRIAAYSEPGHGATFRVYLPVVELTMAPEIVEPPPPLAAAHERVMVVDDEESIRGFVARMLSEAGYRVETYTDGLEAWLALAADPSGWDVLITDQTMPEMTGLELAARVAGIRPDLPVILCSGYSAALNGGADAKAEIFTYLEKPVSRNTLLTQVARALAETKSGFPSGN